MKVYTYSEARQNLASVLDQAANEGEVMIRRRDGQTYLLKSIHPSGSPLDVAGIDLDVSADEIVSIIREGRERNPITE